MKLFALESEDNAKLTDVDLDKNLMEAASEYYHVKNDIREVRKGNVVRGRRHKIDKTFYTGSTDKMMLS